MLLQSKESRLMKKAIQFGAGNIGRGFIGALLHEAGYHVVFADVAEKVINEINEKKEYTIFIKDVELEEIRIDNISGVSSISDAIFKEIEEAEIITTAVGPLVLEKIAPTIAKGIKNRIEKNIDRPLNIIACENAVYASNILKDNVYELLTEEEIRFVEKNIGFPNCSVDRIVPPSTNPNMLDVTVEKFYEWNVEKDGFRGQIPAIVGMNLADNLLAYIERKLFTLNTGHAITSYLGVINGLPTIDKSIADADTENIVRSAMQESGNGLIDKFGFDKDTHYKYIEKIIARFKNPYLNDDVKRVGREPLRKLSENDRLVKPLVTALQYGHSVDNLVLGIGAALNYYAESDPQSIELKEKIDRLGIREAIKDITKIENEDVIEKIEKAYFVYNK